MHSFTGTSEEAEELLSFENVYIGENLSHMCLCVLHIKPCKMIDRLTLLAGKMIRFFVLTGINGCSLKSEENLSALAVIPTHRLMIETDSPYCEIRGSHASKQYVKTTFQSKDKKKYNKEYLVKGRNEPCTIQ